jgi:pSer/pThr/pTyr-binding forkhead associated (FHA) protein
MWKLVIEDDEGKRTVVPLTREDYTIGRQEGNTIRLTERNVSRSHGRIRRKAARGGNGASKDNFLVEDRQSYNGVFVNGLRVAHTQDLAHGDLIQIGDYRIVLQDDAVSAIETASIPITTTEDAKATVPMAASFRGQAMTERPNRLVMLVGPTPGVEYPLEHERMSIGRAEDASISVNHNSVSRLHCEVHALGDGRYEIVDKASSNGVRVNGVELRRSIIEAGDVIELGDVRFKFVGAGQVFVPGPNESQQLTAISDREAELVENKRGWGGYMVPVVAAGVIGAALILGFVYMLRARAQQEPQQNLISPTNDAEQALVTEAKQKCAQPTDDCDWSYQRITSLPSGSVWRSSADFKAIIATWADSTMRRASAASDNVQKRALYTRVAGEQLVDPAVRKQASDALGAIPDDSAQNPNTLPSARDAGTTLSSAVVPPPPTRDPNRPPPTAHTTATAPTTTTVPTTPPSATTTKPSGAGAMERAQQAALEGRPKDVRAELEPAVRSGKASLGAARLVREACKQMGDMACKADIDAKYPQLAGGGH